MDRGKEFVPALGLHALTGAYDRVVALTTRERRWRAELLRLVAPRRADRIVDVGCGTGTFASMLVRVCPDAEIVGIDPDVSVLELARKKVGATVELCRGYGDELAQVLAGRTFTKVVSCLVLHQCPLPTKLAILRSMHDVLAPSGQLFLADYGLQRTPWMRLFFRSVQLLDGVELTQPNADGRVPELIEEAGFVRIEEVFVLPTPTGSISIHRAEKQA